MHPSDWGALHGPTPQPASTGGADLHVIIRRDPDGRLSYLPGPSGTGTVDQILALNKAAKDTRGVRYCSLGRLLKAHTAMVNKGLALLEYLDRPNPYVGFDMGEVDEVISLRAALKAATGGENGT